MAISDELTRIQTAKADIKASIEAKGVTVSDSTLISGYAALVDEIQTGGGGGQAEQDLIDLIEGDIVTLNIPNGTTKIGNYAFYNCRGLTSVTIPDSVTSIGIYAFSYSGLTSVTIPNSVTSIGNSAFSYSGLTSVTIPNSVTSIGDEAFSYSGLTSVTIPNSVTSIGDEAFYNCEKLSNITILATTPPTVNLGYSTPTYYVFVPSESVDTYKAADGWKRYPNNIYSLPILKGEYLTGTIEMPSNRTFYLKEIFHKSYPIYFEKLYINDIEVYTDYRLEAGTSYTFKFELFDKRLIGGRLFADPYYNMVTSIIIPDSVTSIGNEAFYNCRGLTSVTIPNSVTSIGDNAFQSTSLTEIIIPDSVTSIGNNILNYNNEITNITILATTPPTLKTSAISGSNNCPIYVPVESVDAYKQATNWSSLADRIQAIPAE